MITNPNQGGPLVGQDVESVKIYIENLQSKNVFSISTKKEQIQMQNQKERSN
jgi:hypothetical protein